jgi:predicted transcriptional regulator
VAKNAARSVGLLSIHPKHVEAILSGRKRVEFRRGSFPGHLTHVVVYATAPKSKIVALLSLTGADMDRPTELWSRHGEAGAITREAFDKYYEEAVTGIALSISSVTSFTPPIDLHEVLPHGRPPQSFRYLRGAALSAFRRLAVERAAPAMAAPG